MGTTFLDLMLAGAPLVGTGLSDVDRSDLAQIAFDVAPPPAARALAGVDTDRSPAAGDQLSFAALFTGSPLAVVAEQDGHVDDDFGSGALHHAAGPQLSDPDSVTQERAWEWDLHHAEPGWHHDGHVEHDHDHQKADYPDLFGHDADPGHHDHGHDEH